ncbi:MAG: hypothetical protein ABIP51_14805, partial [Bacteroidia bacterium]
MKKIYLLLLAVILITACKKDKTQPEEPASQNNAANTTPSSTYKKLKTIRSVDTYTFGSINIMNQMFTYNLSTGRLISIAQMDSSF